MDLQINSNKMALTAMGALSFLILASRYLKKQRRKLHRMCPMNREKNSCDNYFTAFKFMKDTDPKKFFEYTRMTSEQFNALHNLVQHRLQKTYKKALSVEHRLAITLYYLSSGRSMHQVAAEFFIGRSTAHCIITETCDVIIKVLSPLCLPPPDKKEWNKIADEFYKTWNIPNCIGALDGKYINIQPPKKLGSEYLNKCSGVIFLATCDAYCKFTNVDIVITGQDNIGFRDCNLGKAFMENELDIPDNKYLPGTQINTPYFVVADHTFPLHEHIMRPFPGHNLDNNKLIFNYRLSSPRKTIENLFGMLANRWAILRSTIIAIPDNVQKFIRTIVVLHNFLQKSEEGIQLENRTYCPIGFVDFIDDNGMLQKGFWRNEPFKFRSIKRFGANNSKKTFAEYRNNLLNFFTSPQGQLPGQENAALCAER